MPMELEDVTELLWGVHMRVLYMENIKLTIMKLTLVNKTSLDGSASLMRNRILFGF